MAERDINPTLEPDTGNAGVGSIVPYAYMIISKGEIIMGKQLFDGYANAYDQWFMKNENVFRSELNLYKKALGDTTDKTVLSVGCGTGLFESNSNNLHVEGLEPSEDMAKIAEKRGLSVKVGIIEEAKLKNEFYDVIYFNGSSSYIPDLKKAYKKAYDALKKGGKLILFDVPKESAFGFMYLLAKSVQTFEHEFLKGSMPEVPYPLELVSAGYWHTTEDKINALKDLGMKNFSYYQTLLANPMYTNEQEEGVIEGYKSGGYVAIIAEK